MDGGSQPHITVLLSLHTIAFNVHFCGIFSKQIPLLIPGITEKVILYKSKTHGVKTQEKIPHLKHRELMRVEDTVVCY